jgi:Zn-dependent metalloprotease
VAGRRNLTEGELQLDEQGRHLFGARTAAALFYLAPTAHLSRQSDFDPARPAAVLAAQALFRNDPDRDSKVNAVNDACASVGIPGARRKRAAQNFHAGHDKE